MDKGELIDIPIRVETYAANTRPTPEQAASLLAEMLPNLERAVEQCKAQGGVPQMALFAETPLGNLLAAKFEAEVFVASVKALVFAVQGKGEAPRIIIPG